ncbi:hypothetical protein E4U39_001686 [Claviceps sp. Clav50 group G5]|nr:hypothetical protein E4U39_001686 [Claviceps sp. Clav50 group G5]
MFASSMPCFTEPPILSAPRSEGSSQGSRKNCIRDEADTASRDGFTRRVAALAMSIIKRREIFFLSLCEAALSEHIVWL